MVALERIRKSPILSCAVAMVCGVGLWLAYSLARAILWQPTFWLVNALFDPASPNIWVVSTVLSIAFSVVAGLFASLIVMPVLLPALKPKTLVIPQVAIAPFIVLNYWWFVSDVPGAIKSQMPEQIFVALVQDVGAVAVWLLLSWWLVRRNAPNKRSQPRPLRGPAAG